MRTWDDEKSVIYLLLLLVQHGQNNYFFGGTKLEKIQYIVTKSELCEIIKKRKLSNIDEGNETDQEDGRGIEESVMN